MNYISECTANYLAKKMILTLCRKILPLINTKVQRKSISLTIYIYIGFCFVFKQDYYGFSNGTLKKDSSNDWILLSSVATNNQRKLTIQRQLVTDDAHDFNITVTIFLFIYLVLDF